jgi:hypothetical protein
LGGWTGVELLCVSQGLDRFGMWRGVLLYAAQASGG